MTGIERLHEVVRELGRFSFCYDLYETLGDIADQIESERECERDTIENVRLIVGGVVDEMERHVSGVEGADDSPVARWARELRRALKSDTSDGRDAQNPSCHDPADAADVTSEAPKVTRDPADDVSMSAYDLLPADEREAIAWVREHGGLDSVKRLLDWVVGHCSTRQQLDFDFWLSGRVMHELGFDEDMADRDEVGRRLLARLMPEGMEWLVEAWPRYEDGKPLRIGDVVSDVEVRSVVFRDDGILLSDCTSVPGWGTWRSYKEPIKRPAVPASDGKPLREGETVWHIKTGREYVVVEPSYGDTVVVRLAKYDDAEGEQYAPDQLTHERPVADTWERLEEDARSCTCVMEAIDLVRRARALAERERGE